MTIRFAAIAIDHRHIFDHIEGMLEAGGLFAGYTAQSTAPAVVAEVARRWPDVPQASRERLLDDPSISVICTSAVPNERAAVAIEAMQAGKDVMVDKPGMTSFEQLSAIQKTVAQTGRLFSVCFSERLCVPCAQRAGELIAAGAIGRVVQTLGMGPHRLNRQLRPAWFFDTSYYGGILTDIASHQIDQFLFYTGSQTARIVASTVGNYGTQQNPAFQDFGQILLQSERASGYVRVDWFTPDGLPTWGDGRLTILGTQGYIELRKYVDIAGRPGQDHLFLVDGKGVRYIDCAGLPLTYFRRFLDDVRNRTETAMAQAHVFEAMRLSLEAQSLAQTEHMQTARGEG
jgi:predicted dehydrogenase